MKVTSKNATHWRCTICNHHALVDPNLIMPNCGRRSGHAIEWLLYELGEAVHDVPRFEGDTILCGTKFSVLLNGVKVASIYEHPNRYTGGCVQVSMTKIRWAGPRPSVLAPGASLFHDFVSDDTVAACVLSEVATRIGCILKWRNNQADCKP